MSTLGDTSDTDATTTLEARSQRRMSATQSTDVVGLSGRIGRPLFGHGGANFVAKLRRCREAGLKWFRRRRWAGLAHWRFFLGACFLTGSLLLPHGGRGPVVAGMALAALVHWGIRQSRGRRE
jgi:hypothetical protein